MVFDLPCVVQRSRNKDWWLCFLLFCASHQCWELVLGTWARLKGLRPALELRYWNSWRVLAWVSFPHPRQPLLSVAKEATLLLVDCQAWEHLYLHPPPLAGTWRLQNPTPPHCPHSTAVGVQMEKWCSLFFSFLFIYISIYIHLFQICSRLLLVVVNPQVSLVCSQSLLLCWVSWFRGTRAPPCLWRVRRVHNRNSKHHLLQPRLLPNTPALQHRQARWWLLLVLNFLPRMQGWTLRATARHSSNGYSSKARNEGYLPRQR